MIALEVEEFQAWFKTLTVAPVIKALRKAAGDHIESLLYLFDLEQEFEQDLTGGKKELVN